MSTTSSSDSDRKKPTYHFDRNAAEYRSQFKTDHRGHARQVPDGVDRHLRRALGRGRQQRGVRARPLPRRLQRPRHQQRAPRLQGHLDPDGQPRQRGARRHPGDGRPRTPHLPHRAQPLSVAGRGQALGAVHRRRDPRLPRREDRRRQHRLRRRPGQHRARRADPGDAGHPAEEVEPVQRAGSRGGVHPGALPGHRARHRDAPARWGSTWSTTCSRSARIRAPAS